MTAPARLPPLHLALYAGATLVPAALLAAGLAGVVWPGACLLWMAVLVAAGDEALPLAPPEAVPGERFPATEALTALIAIAHLALLPATVAVVAGPGPLAAGARIALGLGAGLWIGQVAVPAAHELIHAPRRWQRRAGAAIYAAILFGHHASAHPLVHHVHVATAADPNTPRRGEGCYRFLTRAWAGSFRAGLAAERARRRGPAGARRGGINPYVWYLAGAAAALAAAWALAGWAGVAAWVLISGQAQAQLLLADYVQHYGLARATLPGGRVEPVGPRHSWNAPHWLSGATMLNAPRHSDHHARPARPFPALRRLPPSEAPELPLPLPLAVTVALVPPLWRRMMAPRLAALRAVAGAVAGAGP